VRITVVFRMVTSALLTTISSRIYGSVNTPRVNILESTLTSQCSAPYRLTPLPSPRLTSSHFAIHRDDS
jgi:hypothetical protein